MKLFIFPLILLLSFSVLNAQENEYEQTNQRGISMVNQETGKEVFIKENKRIRIKPFEGKKVKGRFKIYNQDTIFVKNNPYNIQDLQKIKRNPLVQSILINGTLYFYGYGFIASGIFFALIPNCCSSLALPLIAIGTPMVVGAILSPNLLRGYKQEKGWTYKIQM
ncbi:MAG: hypothetical protein LAT51_12465 [Flavobacteriaceae bacterium]|nr:hypothetical protein [Flavobacteriaceae bacterium]